MLQLFLHLILFRYDRATHNSSIIRTYGGPHAFYWYVGSQSFPFHASGLAERPRAIGEDSTRSSGSVERLLPRLYAPHSTPGAVRWTRTTLRAARYRATGEWCRRPELNRHGANSTGFWDRNCGT